MYVSKKILKFPKISKTGLSVINPSSCNFAIMATHPHFEGCHGCPFWLPEASFLFGLLNYVTRAAEKYYKYFYLIR